MRKNGFTLIELLIVVAILVILTTVVASSGKLSSSKGVRAEVQTSEKKISIISYGNGVWLIKDVSTWGIDGDAFAHSVAEFRGAHPTEDVVTAFSLDRNANGNEVESILVLTRDQ